MKPTLFFNLSGRDFPDYKRKLFDSIAVIGGRVLENGFALETMTRYKDFDRVNMQGTVILPAFSDSHVHLLQTGLVLTGCSLSKASCLGDVFDCISKSISKSDENWILGWNIDETKLKEKRLPTIGELDKISKTRKIWISRVDLHSAIPNTAAFSWAKAKIPEVQPEGGCLRKADYYLLSAQMVNELSEGLKLASLKLACQECVSKGVSTVHALEGGEGISFEDVQLISDFFNEAPIHGVIYHQAEDPSLVKENRWNKIGGCLCVDGSIGSRTAALSSPYSDDPGNTGSIYRDSEKIQNLIKMCSEENLQLAMHAIGDRAIGILTSAHSWGRKTFGPPTLPHRIEHFTLPPDLSFRQAREAGLLISVQPAFELFWGEKNGMYSQRLGENRFGKTNPFKTMMSCGLSIAGGSDSPVTPVDPLLGIHGFLNHPNVEERIDLNAALAAFIVEPHRFSGEENCRGRLAKGFFADFIRLNKDPFIVHPQDFREISVTELYIRGENVYIHIDRGEKT